MSKNAPTPEQIARLPRWAQQHIADLEAGLRHREEAFRVLSLEHEPAEGQGHFEVRLSGLITRISLPSSVFAVSYVPATGGPIEISSEQRGDREQVLVRGNGRGVLHMLPQSGNTIRVYQDGAW